MFSYTMIKFLGMKDLRDETEAGFDQKSFIPCPFFAVFEVLLRRICFAKTKIAQRNGLFIIYCRNLPERIVWRFSSVPSPVDDISGVVQHPTQFYTDNPAPIRFAFAPDLLLTPSFAARMDEFDTVCIRNSEE